MDFGNLKPDTSTRNLSLGFLMQMFQLTRSTAAEQSGFFCSTFSETEWTPPYMTFTFTFYISYYIYSQSEPHHTWILHLLYTHGVVLHQSTLHPFHAFPPAGNLWIFMIGCHPVCGSCIYQAGGSGRKYKQTQMKNIQKQMFMTVCHRVCGLCINQGRWLCCAGHNFCQNHTKHRNDVGFSQSPHSIRKPTQNHQTGGMLGNIQAPFWNPTKYFAFVVKTFLFNLFGRCLQWWLVKQM